MQSDEAIHPLDAAMRARRAALRAAAAGTPKEASLAPDIDDFWAAAKSRCEPKALSAAWQYGRALASGADAWMIARTYLDAVYARRDAWEAMAADPDDDDRPFPSELREELEQAVAGLLAVPAPHWQGVADKVRFLLNYIDDGVWEPGWMPNPQVGGMAGAVARAMICAEQNGTAAPSVEQVLAAAMAAEDLAYTAAHASDGYRSYAINPDAIGEMATIVGAIQRDARALSRNNDRQSALAITAVWFPDQIGEAVVQ